ncbi:MAG: nitrous oxide reductase accessory protein NosL [Desulfobacterales bacterium]
MSIRLASRSPFQITCCLTGILLAIIWSAAAVRAAGPAPGRHPLDANRQMQVSAEDRCPVCGMKVAEHATFSSAIQLTDGTTYYFCGTGCMLRSWLHPEIFLAADKGRLQTPLVKEYFTGTQVDGREVFWVAGSDVVGPMGPALVPVMDEKALEAFKRRHGGKAVFRMQSLTDEKWVAITGRKAAQ